MLSTTSTGNGCTSAKSLTATRPPGFNTRAISAHTCSLSGDKLITQFDITTSTDASDTGRCSISPSRNSTLSSPVRSLYVTVFRRALPNISGVMSTPITLPVGPTLRPAINTSNPPPLPKSSTVSPAFSPATAVGFPQDNPMFAPSGSAASSSTLYPTDAASAVAESPGLAPQQRYVCPPPQEPPVSAIAA
ncbi:MAG: hypothetical protein JW395_1988 [Nitrospira sp.]|nr:hypothetical protein [Nitrospira sp.]